MSIEAKRDFLIKTAYVLVILAGIYLGYTYLFPILLPFLLGLFVAYIVVKISNRIQNNNKWVRILIALILYATVGGLFVLLAIKGIDWIHDFVEIIPDLYETSIVPIVETIHLWMINFVEQLDPDMYATVELVWENLFSSLNEVISFISTVAVDFVSSIIQTLPILFISMLMMIISSFFFAVDYENIIIFYQKHVPEKGKEQIKTIREYLSDTLLVVLRSYILIMLLTFSEISILFLLFGLEQPFLTGGIIAVFDIMPALGTGGILIPWTIFSLLTKNYIKAIKLIVIYGIVTVVRNYVEPKIVGGQLGLHPIISLVSMFIGLRLFGFVGMFAFPVIISYFWKRYKEKQIL